MIILAKGPSFRCIQSDWQKLLGQTLWKGLWVLAHYQCHICHKIDVSKQMHVYNSTGCHCLPLLTEIIQTKKRYYKTKKASWTNSPHLQQQQVHKGGGGRFYFSTSSGVGRLPWMGRISGKWRKLQESGKTCSKSFSSSCNIPSSTSFIQFWSRTKGCQEGIDISFNGEATHC